MPSELDPASLDNLHDIIVPEAVSFWWPLAPGWWIVLGSVLLLSVAWVWQFTKARRRNAYRRAALTQLTEISDHPRALPVLLKRVALSAYPRSDVAKLSGDRWLAFLNREAPGCFDEAAGGLLLALAYRNGRVDAWADEDVVRLLDSARRWIENHHGKEEAPV